MAPMLRSRESQIVLEFSFWESAEEVKDPEGLYELRSYRLKVGPSWRVFIVTALLMSDFRLSSLANSWNGSLTGIYS